MTYQRFIVSSRFEILEIGQELGDYCQANGKSSSVTPAANVRGLLVDSETPCKELEILSFPWVCCLSAALRSMFELIFITLNRFDEGSQKGHPYERIRLSYRLHITLTDNWLLSTVLFIPK